MGKGTSKAGKVAKSNAEMSKAVKAVSEPKSKNDYINRLRVIAEHSGSYGYEKYSYRAVESEWAKGNNDRTYLKIIQYRNVDGRKHGERDYGYYDNKKGQYVQTKTYSDLDGKVFSYSGAEMSKDDIAKAISSLEKKQKYKK